METIAHHQSPVVLELPPAILLGEVIIIKLIRDTSKAGFTFAKLVTKRMD